MPLKLDFTNFRKVKNSKIKCTVDITVAEAITIRGVKMIDAGRGLFMAMPSTTWTDKEGQTHHTELCVPATPEFQKYMFRQLRDILLDASPELWKEVDPKTPEEDSGEPAKSSIDEFLENLPF